MDREKEKKREKIYNFFSKTAIIALMLYIQYYVWICGEEHNLLKCLFDWNNELTVSYVLSRIVAVVIYISSLVVVVIYVIRDRKSGSNSGNH